MGVRFITQGVHIRTWLHNTDTLVIYWIPILNNIFKSIFLNHNNIYNHIILIYCNFRIQIMSHKMLRPFIVKVSVLDYFPLYSLI